MRVPPTAEGGAARAPRAIHACAVITALGQSVGRPGGSGYFATTMSVTVIRPSNGHPPPSDGNPVTLV
jgi:hypothetical protein